MKRNWETIRDLLSRVEACTLPMDAIRLNNFPQDKHTEVSYHMALLIEAGLVKGWMSQTIGPEIKDFVAQRLTWEGHELLDSIRSDTVWTKTKKIFTDVGLDMVFDMVKTVTKEVATSMVKAAIGGP